MCRHMTEFEKQIVFLLKFSDIQKAYNFKLPEAFALKRSKINNETVYPSMFNLSLKFILFSSA